MKLILENDLKFDINLIDSPVGQLVQRWLHHLRHVDLPWRPWDYNGYNTERSKSDVVDSLVAYAKILKISVDRDRVLKQDYLNELHRIFETSYDGQQIWTDYHEHIHLLESHAGSQKHVLELNYRHFSGPLNKPFQMEWLDHGKTILQAGDVYLAWDELGKTPRRYWQDHEPNDISRLCQLAKPWLTIRPKIHVCLEDTDCYPGEDKSFQDWWSKFERDWCSHWRIPTWSQQDAAKVLVIGKLEDWKNLEKNLDQRSRPLRIIL